MTADEEKKVLQLCEDMVKIGHGELVIQFQDGKPVSAEVKKKIKLR